MPIRKLKPVEANDGSYGGLVLDAFDRLEAGLPLASDISQSPPAPVAAVSPGIPHAIGATLSARLAAVRSDIAAIRSSQDVAASADPTSRDNLRKSILHSLTALLNTAAEYAHRLDAERAAVTPDQGRINRLQSIVALAVADIEEYERMAAELAGVPVLQMAAE